MCTLTTKFGITWNIIRLAGKTAFVHQRLVIAYSLRDKQYHLCQNGKSIYAVKTAGECLDASSELILDAYANGIMPMWSSDEDEEPITQRYPSGYIPNWAEAAA